jgi:glutathione S-transferase
MEHRRDCGGQGGDEKHLAILDMRLRGKTYLVAAQFFLADQSGVAHMGIIGRFDRSADLCCARVRGSKYVYDFAANLNRLRNNEADRP